MKRLALVLLLGCGKKTAPPLVVVDASPPAAPAPSPSVPLTRACDLTVETKSADVVVVNGWRAASAKAAGFEEEKMPTDADAKSTLCRMDACSGTPPWIVKPRVTPHPDPTNLIAPLPGNRFVVLRVGSTGADFCEGKNDAVNRFVNDPSIEGDVIVYDEEITPLRPAEDGCDQAGPPKHVWHVVDSRSKKDLLLRGTDLTVKVTGRSVKIVSQACAETRSFD